MLAEIGLDSFKFTFLVSVNSFLLWLPEFGLDMVLLSFAKLAIKLSFAVLGESVIVSTSLSFVDVNFESYLPWLPVGIEAVLLMPSRLLVRMVTGPTS